MLHYSEEKIGLSQQIYDYVDQKIRRLDKDLKNFEGDIARERSKLGLAVLSLLLLHLSVAALTPAPFAFSMYCCINEVAAFSESGSLFWARLLEQWPAVHEPAFNMRFTTIPGHEEVSEPSSLWIRV